MPQTVYVTVLGNTYSSGGPEPGVRHLGEGGHDPNLILLFEDIVTVTDAMRGVAALSTTSVTIGAGSHLFALLGPTSWAVGQVIRAASAADPGRYMVGTVTALGEGPDTLTLWVAAGMTGGSGAASDWVLTYPVPGSMPQLALADLPPEAQLACVLALHNA